MLSFSTIGLYLSIRNQSMFFFVILGINHNTTVIISRGWHNTMLGRRCNYSRQSLWKIVPHHPLTRHTPLSGQLGSGIGSVQVSCWLHEHCYIMPFTIGGSTRGSYPKHISWHCGVCMLSPKPSMATAESSLLVHEVVNQLMKQRVPVVDNRATTHTKEKKSGKGLGKRGRGSPLLL